MSAHEIPMGESPARASTGFATEVNTPTGRWARRSAKVRAMVYSLSTHCPRAILLGGFLAGAAEAACGPRLAVLDLAAERGLELTWRGAVEARQMIEVFVAHTGRWVIFGSTPDGQMCVIASGGSFESIPVIPGVPG